MRLLKTYTPEARTRACTGGCARRAMEVVEVVEVVGGEYYFSNQIHTCTSLAFYIYIFYAFFCWTWCVAARTAAPERARVGWGNGATGEHGSMDGLRVQGGISLIHHVQGVS